MANVSCETCVFWTPPNKDDGKVFGICHQVSHQTEASLINRSTVASWWCSCHPLAPGQRDRIAVELLKAMIANHGVEDSSPYKNTSDLIAVAHGLADDVMAERAKRKGPPHS